MDAKELGVIADVFQRVVEEVQTKDNDVANWPKYVIVLLVCLFS